MLGKPTPAASGAGVDVKNTRRCINHLVYADDLDAKALRLSFYERKNK